MESEYKGFANGGIERQGEVMVANKRKVGGWDFLLRLVALVLCLAAAVVVGVNKQTTLVQVVVITGMAPVDIAVTAKWHYLSAFVYLVVANAISCAYAAVSSILALANGGKKKGLALATVILDLVMVVLLFSAIGAALAVGLIGYQGNSHVEWNEVCNNFGRFCHQVAAGLALTAAAAISFFTLVALAVFKLHKRL